MVEKMLERTETDEERKKKLWEKVKVNWFMG